MLWLWRRAKLSTARRLALTSILALVYGFCKAWLRSSFPDPHQDPAGQGLGWAYPLVSWTFVSVVLALWAAGAGIARRMPRR